MRGRAARVSATARDRAAALLPREARVVERVAESRDIFTLRLRLADPALHEGYDFQPGQFSFHLERIVTIINADNLDIDGLERQVTAHLSQIQ